MGQSSSMASNLAWLCALDIWTRTSSSKVRVLIILHTCGKSSGAPESIIVFKLFTIPLSKIACKIILNLILNTKSNTFIIIIIIILINPLPPLDLSF